MRDSGLFSSDERRPINEAWMRARWKLGRVLAKLGRGKAGRPKLGRTPTQFKFKQYVLEELRLGWATALEAQRIGTLPPSELEKIFTAFHRQDDFVTFTDLIVKARLGAIGQQNRRSLTAQMNNCQGAMTVIFGVLAEVCRVVRRTEFALRPSARFSFCWWPMSWFDLSRGH